MQGCGKRMQECVWSTLSVCVWVCVWVFVSQVSVCGRTPLCALAYLAQWEGVQSCDLIEFALQLNRFHSLKSQRHIVIHIFQHVSACFCRFVARYCIPHLLGFCSARLLQRPCWQVTMESQSWCRGCSLGSRRRCWHFQSFRSTYSWSSGTPSDPPPLSTTLLNS